MSTERFCKNCGTELDAKAKFCSECGIRVENVPPTRPIVDLTCEHCGSSLEASPDDPTIAICPHCGHNHMVPMNRSVKIQQIKSDAHKEIELGRQKTLRVISEREQASKEKENETSFLKWLVENLLVRSGTVIGLLFCLLALLFENIRALLISEIVVSVSFAISSSFSLSCFEILTPICAINNHSFFVLLDMENRKEGLFNAVQHDWDFLLKRFSAEINSHSYEYLLGKTLLLCRHM